MPNKTKGDPLVSPVMVCYAEPFWFSSLGQMSQFGTIKLCRTFKNILVSSCGLKKVTIIVAFHFVKRRLKMHRSTICDNRYIAQILENNLFENKPGPAQVGAMSKAQKSKKTSKCQVFSFTVLENL